MTYYREYKYPSWPTSTEGKTFGRPGKKNSTVECNKGFFVALFLLVTRSCLLCFPHGIEFFEGQLHGESAARGEPERTRATGWGSFDAVWVERNGNGWDVLSLHIVPESNLPPLEFPDSYLTFLRWPICARPEMLKSGASRIYRPQLGWRGR